ncbi:AMMECR1 domain protein [Pyrobaculum islandicum DSM 4184]|uniref:AMMECR1 domain protein n=1 Tax=Pyrobaculum islandicum (strain DSM 4184 / JCM 9189 / GEO3) TaxID=384616 RepID=A1RTK1_PYRIL|nr:AMMECR1 domain-containing protein [Pyrobaculum islandicum]ABL88283.1 AMMECR1 domain protein [Pyrobaculum islandicum DSM 4184]
MSLGQALVSHVRSAMLAKLRGQPLPESHPLLSGMKSGVFVTVEAIVRSGGFERREVRGSLGVVEPFKDLAYDTAKIAAKLVYAIPRFTEFDLRRSVIEVTLVEELREWDGGLAGFEWGREGVYAVAGQRRVVVLPQTMIERKILGEALLRYIESMAGPPERLYRFSTRIFYELHPEGEVIERELWKSRVIKQFLEVVR